MASAMYQSPTSSQYASAACHLELRDEWRTVRFGGVRYIALTSGTSRRVYLVRADLRGCACAWSQKCASPCSHRLAIYLADLEDDLREPPVPTLAELRAMWPGCAAGCGSVVESSGLRFCENCDAEREKAQRMAAARAAVLKEWTEG